MSIDSQKQQSTISTQQKKKIPLSKIRRFVMVGVIALFLLQFLRIKVLVGGLSGSLAVWFVKLIDIFAYFESLIASRDFTTTALWAVLPVIAIYLIFGRAFCGWACPMDFLFEMVGKIRGHRQEASGKRAGVISQRVGYIVAALLLTVSALIEIPFFTNYISHLTNFFRAMTGSVFIALNLPFESVVVIYSLLGIVVLLFLEYFYPRLWCRVLCPVGKTYGLFNKVSLLRLKFVEGRCSGCNLCEQMCYMNVKISKYIHKPGLRDTNCIYCGLCVEGCERRSKLIKIAIK